MYTLSETGKFLSTEGFKNKFIHSRLMQWSRFPYFLLVRRCVRRCPSSMNDSVRRCVCLSVRLSHLCNYVPIIVSSWNFQKLLPMTEVMSIQKVKVKGQRSMSQRSKNQFSRLRTVTPVWIRMWWWNPAESLMLLRRGVLLCFRVIC